MIKDVVPQSFSPLDRALVGGKRRHRKMRGGSMILQPADVGATAVGGLSSDGPVIGLTSYSGDGANDVQIRAGQAGGRSRSRGKSMGKSMGMMGGTIKYHALEGAPLEAALNA
jgi:hypothetical protein